MSSGASKQQLGKTKPSNNQYHRLQDLIKLNVRVTNRATSCEVWGHETGKIAIKQRKNPFTLKGIPFLSVSKKKTTV